MASVSNLEVFDTTVLESYAWIDDLLGETGWVDRHEALQAMRGTFHALREVLTVDQNAKLAAQLPMLLRGIYFEGWDPGRSIARTKTAFVERAAREMNGYVTSYGIDLVVSSVLAILQSRLAGECRKIKLSLPSELRELWPV